jgi:hypothetical protein
MIALFHFPAKKSKGLISYSYYPMLEHIVIKYNSAVNGYGRDARRNVLATS